MNSFELNKIAGAILATFLVILGMQFISGAIFTHKKLEKPGYDIAVTVVSGAQASAPAEPAVPIAELLGKGNVEKGQNLFKQCAACHTPEKGGATKVGPNLYSILEEDKTAVAGFKYSDGLKKKGGKWTFEDLSAFLENPKAFAPGTNMAFAGFKKGSDRADMLVYLRSLADSPVALPK